MGFLSATKPFNFPIFTDAEFLTEEESEKLEVLFSRLFPADHSKGIPGASDAKAHRYVSRLLALDPEEYHKIIDWRKAFREGLRDLEKAALDQYSLSLTKLSDTDIDTLLRDLEIAQLEGTREKFDQSAFFRLLREHCIKGCFADPRWGGNENKIMWRWLGWIQPAEDINFGDE